MHLSFPVRVDHYLKAQSNTHLLNVLTVYFMQACVPDTVVG